MLTAQRVGEAPRAEAGLQHGGERATTSVVVPGGPHAWKVIIPPGRDEPELRSHEGYEWLYVLAGRMRLILADHDITMGPGEVAEFDTRLPHWFGPADNQPVEILSLFGKQGERIHVRAAPRPEVNTA